jgi:hypothetical protein
MAEQYPMSKENKRELWTRQLQTEQTPISVLSESTQGYGLRPLVQWTTCFSCSFCSSKVALVSKSSSFRLDDPSASFTAIVYYVSRTVMGA